ncbi:larval cuticle protein A3A-like [Stomoxys calcitrans]|uniref:larval cuticle protein A3A-like n=1 Tax=Stomoxys calcitrans TaxID=35570 RepID=UPI0027E3607F|nr:larval cuticle protein A3A-like [Stomoxys calcitrans]
MLLKFNVILAFVAIASAEILLGENVAHPRYDFSYHVNDALTGDVKSHQESRDGHNVQGQYSLNDADGYKRIVDYSVNGQSGFRAVVRREPLVGNGYGVKESIAIAASPQPLEQTPSTAYLRAPVVQHQQHASAPFIHLHHTGAQQNVLHSAPATTVLKSSPAIISTTYHHQAPHFIHHAPSSTVVHQAPQTTAAVLHHHQSPSFAAAPPVSYVHYL